MAAAVMSPMAFAAPRPARKPVNKWLVTVSVTFGTLMGAIDASIVTVAVSGSNVYAGGWFTTAGGIPANRIAKWEGSSWSALGSGIVSGGFAIAIRT